MIVHLGARNIFLIHQQPSGSWPQKSGAEVRVGRREPINLGCGSPRGCSLQWEPNISPKYARKSYTQGSLDRREKHDSISTLAQPLPVPWRCIPPLLSSLSLI